MQPLDAATGWLNGGPVGPGALRGAPVLVHFWATGCDGCKEQLPAVLRWAKEHGPEGLRVIGVHTPAQGVTPPGLETAGVRRAAEELGIRHPVALDHGELAATWHVHAVPAYFVFDDEGLLRHFQAGLGAEPLVERALQRVLREHEQAAAGDEA